MPSRIGYHLAAVGLIFCIAFMGYVTYLAVWPFKTIEPTHQPYKVLTPKVHPGEDIVYVSEICRYTDVQPTVVRQLVGESIIYLPNRISKFPKGCGAYKVPSRVPPETPPGFYHLELAPSYRINPVRTIVVNIETEEFEVVEPPIDNPLPEGGVPPGAPKQPANTEPIGPTLVPAEPQPQPSPRGLQRFLNGTVDRARGLVDDIL